MVDHDFLHRHHVIVIHLTTDDLDEVLVSLPLHILHAHFVHLVDDTLIVRLEHLRAILPVSLVSVVLFRVVRSGDVHTTLTFEVTDSETNLRSRTERLEQVHLDTVSREDVGYGLCEETTVVTAIVTYHNSHLAVLYVLKTTFTLHLEQVVRITLGSLCHNVFVHSVGTYSHDTAQTAGTEFEGTIECVNEFGLVLCVHEGFHLCACLCIKRFASPHLSDFHYFFQFFVHGVKS